MNEKKNNTVLNNNKDEIKKILLKAIKTVDERSLFIKIDRFYTRQCSCKKKLKMIRIINNENLISLRLLNWFAMKHSSNMKALEIISENNNIILFDVKISYKARLKTHSKKYFDPFRRGSRFNYCYDGTKYIETTLCQLNFFKWLFMNNLINYVEKNLDYLKHEMGIYEKRKKNLKKKEKEENTNKIKKKINYNIRNDNKLIIIL